MTTNTTRDFYRSASQIACLIENDSTPNNVKTALVEEVTNEITDIVKRLNFSDTYVIEHLYPMLKDLEQAGKVWGKDGSQPKIFVPPDGR